MAMMIVLGDGEAVLIDVICTLLGLGKGLLLSGRDCGVMRDGVEALAGTDVGGVVLFEDCLVYGRCGLCVRAADCWDGKEG